MILWVDWVCLPFHLKGNKSLSEDKCFNKTNRTPFLIELNFNRQLINF